VWGCPNYAFTIKFQYEPKRCVRRGVLGSEIQNPAIITFHAILKFIERFDI
jgi:hypothetical protein